MSTLLVSHTMSSTTGIPADDVVNTFHFITAAPGRTAADVTEAFAAVKEFFDTVTTTGKAVRQLLATSYLNGNAVMRLYDLSDPSPRPLRASEAYAMGARGGTGLDRASALCASYAADPVAGVPPARLRGRVYLGPLSSLTADFAIIDNDYRPTTTTMQTVVAALARLIARPVGLGAEWVVHSRTDGVARRVTRGWCDNAIDTQRRRGLGATQRLST